MRQAARLDAGCAENCPARALAPRARGQSAAEARHRHDEEDPGAARRASRRNRAGLRHGRLRDGPVDYARRARGRRSGVGGFRQALGRRHHGPAAASRRPRARGGLRRSAQSRCRGFRSRRRLHLERDHVGRARSGQRLDRAGPPRPDVRGRHLRRLRAGDRLGESRCRDLLLAEGHGRGGRSRHADLVAAGDRASRELCAGLATAEAVPPDRGRPGARRSLRGRHHQHALDAVRRGLPRRA